MRAEKQIIQSHHQQRQFSVNHSVGILGACLIGRHIFREELMAVITSIFLQCI
jgi:hypothetical protein